MPAIVEHHIIWNTSASTALVTAKSSFTGITHSRSMPMTFADYTRWQGTGIHIQTALPDLTPDDREFLLTGATPEEWHEAFGSDD